MDSGFQSLEGFRIPGTGFQYLSVEVGFGISIVSGIRIPQAVFRIPKPRILDSISKIFPDSGFQNPDFLTWGETLLVSVLTLLETVSTPLSEKKRDVETFRYAFSPDPTESVRLVFEDMTANLGYE